MPKIPFDVGRRVEKTTQSPVATQDPSAEAFKRRAVSGLATAGKELVQEGIALHGRFKAVKTNEEVSSSSLGSVEFFNESQQISKTDQDLDTWETRYDDSSLKKRSELTQNIKDQQAQFDFQKSYDLANEANKVKLTNLYGKRIIDKSKITLNDELDHLGQQFIGADSPQGRQVILKATKQKFVDSVEFGVYTGSEAQKRYDKFEDEVIRASVFNDIESQPDQVSTRIKDGFYGDLSSEDKIEYNNLADKEIKKQENISKEQKEEVQNQTDQEFSRMAREGDLDLFTIEKAEQNETLKQADATRLRNFVNNPNSIISKTKPSTFNGLFIDALSKPTSSTEVRNNSIDASNKNNLAFDDVNLIDQISSLPDDQRKDMIRANGLSIIDWSQENVQADLSDPEYDLIDVDDPMSFEQITEDAKSSRAEDMLKKFYTRVIDENATDPEAIDAIRQDVLNGYMRDNNPEIRDLKEVPNMTYDRDSLKSISKTPDTKKPDLVYDSESGKAFKNNQEGEYFTVYIPERKSSIGFNQKYNHREIQSIIENTYYPELGTSHGINLLTKHISGALNFMVDESNAGQVVQDEEIPADAKKQIVEPGQEGEPITPQKPEQPTPEDKFPSEKDTSLRGLTPQQDKFPSERGDFLSAPDPTFLNAVRDMMKHTGYAANDGYRIGKHSTNIGLIGNALKNSKLTKEQAIKLEAEQNAKIAEIQSYDDIPDNIINTLVGATSGIMPYLLHAGSEGNKAGLASGLGTAAVGSIGGVVPGGAAFVWGYSFGSVFGTVNAAREVEGGKLYLEMVKSDIDEPLARTLSDGAGIAIGLIEIAQIGTILKGLPGGKQFFKKKLIDTIKKPSIARAIGRGLKTFGITLGSELAQEEAQEGIAIGAEVMAHAIRAMQDGKVYEGPKTEKILNKLWGTFTGSLKAFPLLLLPGAVSQVTTDIVTTKVERKASKAEAIIVKEINKQAKELGLTEEDVVDEESDQKSEVVAPESGQRIDTPKKQQGLPKISEATVGTQTFQEETQEVGVKQVGDPARINELENSIREGELILEGGKDSTGKKMSKDALDAVQRSVDNTKAKLKAETTPITPDEPLITPDEREALLQGTVKGVPLAELDKGISIAKKARKESIAALEAERNVLVVARDILKKQDKSVALVNNKIRNIENRIDDIQAIEKEAEIKGIKLKDAQISGKPSNLNFSIRRDVDTQRITRNIQPAKSPAELKERILQLNKFAQANAILRRTGKLKSAKASGQFAGEGDAGSIQLRGKFIANDRDYIGVLAHELGHAVDFAINGKTDVNTFSVFGADLDPATLANINEELKAITAGIVGEKEIAKSPEYYNSPTELLARFFEEMMLTPEIINELAPNAMEALEKQAINHPIIGEFLEVAVGNFDKGVVKESLFNDMRQMYQKHLGKRVGNVAYDNEIVHRAMQERAKFVITRDVKAKFKDVKDDQTLLFKTAESIKVTTKGVPVFGTRDFARALTKEDQANLEEMGWERTADVMDNGELVPQYARPRYTPEESRALFNQLSPAGQELIKGFTAARDEAQDFFNREVIKDVNGINSNIEGWVHHFFEDKGGALNKALKLKEKVAGTKKRREGAEGFVEDFQKAMTKVLVDLESTDKFNTFINKQLAIISKPIPEGQNPDPGWVEVHGDIKKGVGTPQEKKVIVIKDGKPFVPKQSRLQIPQAIYERYKLWRGLTEEASRSVKVLAGIMRYWRINVLFHPGTASTNFISGGVTYGAKVMTDFYTELLTGNVGFEKTRSNINAMLTTMMPKGWDKAPDWIYGGDLSNYYGQFTKVKEGDIIDNYGNKALKMFGTVERYWKKVIATAEGVGDLTKLNEMTKEGLTLPSREDEALIASINKEIDLFAYDYDNIPLWLQNHNKSVVGQAIKPFATYPYKYAKHLTGMIGAAFDRDLPWEERTAKLLTAVTIMSAYAAIKTDRKKRQQTPEGTERTPSRVSPRGRLFVGKDKSGKERFLRTAKYPYANVADAALALSQGDYEAALDEFTDMVGSIGTIGKLGALGLGYRNEYELYTPASAIIGKELSSFIPGFRILNDVAKLLDPYKRKPETFAQGLLHVIPTTNKDLREKLAGPVRTIRIPIESDIKKRFGESKTRTTTERELLNNRRDILLSAIFGTYFTEIDPKEAQAFETRAEKNKRKKELKEAKGGKK